MTAAANGGQLDLMALLAAEDVILRSRREYVGFRLASYQAWLSLEQAVGKHVCGDRCRGDRATP